MSLPAIYLVPGLGADGRLFHRLRLPEGYKFATIEWTPPDENDSLSSYAEKILQQVPLGEPFVLIGVSLGGMLAVEMAKIRKPEKVILISSAKTRSELPTYLRWLSKTKIHRLYPTTWLTEAFILIRPFFGKMPPREYELFKDMFKNVGEEFIDWAKVAVMEWQNEEVPDNLYHIHGTADRILPIKYIKNCTPVQGGSHYMIITKSGEVSRLVQEFLTLKQ